MDSEYTFGSAYIIDDKGNVYNSLRKLAKCIRVDRHRISSNMKKYGAFKHNGITYYPVKHNADEVAKNIDAKIVCADDLEEYTRNKEEFNQWKICKEVEELPFQKYDFKFNDKSKGNRYAIALFSDAHVEETVKPESVLGKNEYNLDIAQKRIETYFVNLANCINADGVKYLIFSMLGDNVSGMIHPELSEENSLSPLQATLLAQNLIFNGLDFIVKNTKLEKIKCIGIVGNHSRITKKIQHSNGYKMSFEWIMYKNIEAQCNRLNMPIEFCIPESELAILDMPDNNRFIFSHGFQIKGGTNTIVGIGPSLIRACLRYNTIFHQQRMFIGHFHSCMALPLAIVNGSIIGYNSFALSHSLPYEEPAQMYVVYDSEIGEMLTRKIYCK